MGMKPTCVTKTMYMVDGRTHASTVGVSAPNKTFQMAEKMGLYMSEIDGVRKTKPGVCYCDVEFAFPVQHNQPWSGTCSSCLAVSIAIRRWRSGGAPTEIWNL